MRVWIPCLVIALTLASVLSVWAPGKSPQATLTFSMLGRYGRFGNQLFQVASVYGMSKTLGIPAVFPRLPELEEAFELTGIARRSEPIQHTRTFHVEDPTRLAMPSPPFQGTIDCRGYFQHQDYFRHVASDIRAAFRLRDPIRRAVAHLVTPHTVGVHVRRGDYEDVLPASYYRDAVTALIDGAKSAHVLVCSDDIAWCRKHLRLDPRWTVTWSPWTRAIDDFATLVACPALVMSNSTFSWWAAWLGDHPRGVIMPWPWFGSGDAWKNEDALSWNREDALANPSWTQWTVERAG